MDKNSKYIVPTCALVASFFGVAIIRYSLGMYFEVLSGISGLLPAPVNFAWRIHDARWWILLVGTAGLVIGCRKLKSESQVHILSAVYMLGWFFLCFLVQFCLVYGLSRR